MSGSEISDRIPLAVHYTLMAMLSLFTLLMLAAVVADSVGARQGALQAWSVQAAITAKPGSTKDAGQQLAVFEVSQL